MFQEFPRMIYRHNGETETKVVDNQEQLDAYLAEGWTKEASPEAPVAEKSVQEEPQPEIENVDTSSAPTT